VVTQGETPDAPGGHETIFTGSIQDSEEPVIVVQAPDDGENIVDEGRILIVWKLSVLLVRPRLRLQNPKVVFGTVANLKPAEQLESHKLREEYLPSQVPSGMNLLEAFGDDPAMKGVKPRLSALRVSRVTPAALTPRDFVRPLKNIARKSFKVYPAINARVRYSRPNSTPSDPLVIAMLDIDITQFASSEVSITKVEANLNGGSTTDLNFSGMSLPIQASPQDDITFLYRLIPSDIDISAKSTVRMLDITIHATAKIAPNSQPVIRMHWTTSLDFTPPINPGFAPITPPIQRAHRPAQLSIGTLSTDTVPTVASLAATRPDALPAIDIQTSTQRDSAIPDFGVTMTFTGSSPDQPIYQGDMFTWSVFIVNRSDRPRKLALMVVPKRRRAEARVTRPPSGSYGGISNGKRDPRVADAVVDENIVHAMQRSSALDVPEVVCLSTDTRVGPLSPLACYEVELKFRALKVGVLGVEAVRVVDMGSNEHVDVKDLPSVVCLARQEE